MDRKESEALDVVDPLANFRSRFVIRNSPLYMDGNSLGRLPVATIDALRMVADAEWGSELVRSWHHWIDLAAGIGDQIAASLLNANAGEVIVSDSTSVNLYKLASAALEARSGRTRILAVADDFPSDLYILQGLAEKLSLQLDMNGRIAEDVALVCRSHINYKTGEIADMKRITDEAHEAGALVLWDLSHSVGAVPVNLRGCNVDLGVGCTYKYLNGGPGAPAFLYVRRDLQEELRQPIWGWFGHDDQFAMNPVYEPAKGVARFLVGTPSVISLKGIEIGVALLAEAGIERLRHKSILLSDLMIALFDERLEPLGVQLASPREPSLRGAHIAFRHPEAWRICRALIENHGVVPDFREPDLVRYGPAPIYTRFVDVWDSVDRLRMVLEGRDFEKFAVERLRVT